MSWDSIVSELIIAILQGLGIAWEGRGCRRWKGNKARASSLRLKVRRAWSDPRRMTGETEIPICPSETWVPHPGPIPSGQRRQWHSLSLTKMNLIKITVRCCPQRDACLSRFFCNLQRGNRMRKRGQERIEMKLGIGWIGCARRR